MNPTPQQSAIIRAFSDPDSLKIVARAGSGKTSTAVMAAKAAQAVGLACAFNKRNAQDLAERMPPGMECRTLNSIGHQAVSKLIGRRPRLDTDKLFNIAKELKLSYEERGPAVALARAGRTAGIVPFTFRPHRCILPDTLESWQDVADHYDLDGDPQHARAILSKATALAFEGLIDFDDQIYITACFGAPLPRYPLVIVDEAQDLNALQHQMIRRLGDRLVMIGDPAQAIYGFRGALSNSMDQLAKHFSPKTLPLTVSFRCPQAVIRHAQQFVPDIEPWDQATEGQVSTEPLPDLPALANATVLCRNNAPLIALAMEMIRARVPCQVLGRDIGTGLTRLVNRLQATSIQGLLQALANWEALEISAHPRREERIRDKADSIRALATGCGSIPDLLSTIKALFSSKHGALLSTIHKAKGREWPTVYILRADLIGGRRNQTAWQAAQERNLHYVAVTRAQQRLIYIQEEV